MSNEAGAPLPWCCVFLLRLSPPASVSPTRSSGGTVGIWYVGLCEVCVGLREKRSQHFLCGGNKTGQRIFKQRLFLFASIRRDIPRHGDTAHVGIFPSSPVITHSLLLAVLTCCTLPTASEAVLALIVFSLAASTYARDGRMIRSVASQKGRK